MENEFAFFSSMQLQGSEFGEALLRSLQQGQTVAGQTTSLTHLYSCTHSYHLVSPLSPLV